jgi:hypothetical protein
MKIMWCWRCKTDVPMLDEDEFAEIAILYGESTAAVKEYRQRRGTSLADTPLQELFAPVCTGYERMTGAKEPDYGEILKHRISLYGPPCKRCHRPLRTPKAKLCGACMGSVDDPTENYTT